MTILLTIGCGSQDPKDKLVANQFTLYLACGYCDCWRPVLKDIIASDELLRNRLTVVSGKQCDLKMTPNDNWLVKDTAQMGQRILPYNQALLVWKEDNELKWLQLNASQSGDLHSLLRRLM